MARILIAAIAGLFLASCATTPGATTGSTPYAAVMKPVPADEDRIYVLAALPGRVRFQSGCTLFERLDGAIVLPVFEAGIVAGRDTRGPWLFDPYSEEYFRDDTKDYAGGGGGGETLADLARRNVLEKAVPARCSAALTDDAFLILNPGLHHVDFDE